MNQTETQFKKPLLDMAGQMNTFATGLLSSMDSLVKSLPKEAQDEFNKQLKGKTGAQMTEEIQNKFAETLKKVNLEGKVNDMMSGLSSKISSSMFEEKMNEMKLAVEKMKAEQESKKANDNAQST